LRAPHDNSFLFFQPSRSRGKLKPMDSAPFSPLDRVRSPKPLTFFPNVLASSLSNWRGLVCRFFPHLPRPKNFCCFYSGVPLSTPILRTCPRNGNTIRPSDNPPPSPPLQEYVGCRTPPFYKAKTNLVVIQRFLTTISEGTTKSVSGHFALTRREGSFRHFATAFESCY